MDARGSRSLALSHRSHFLPSPTAPQNRGPHRVVAKIVGEKRAPAVVTLGFISLW